MQFILLPGMIGTAELFGPLVAVIPADVRTRIISYPPDQMLSLHDLLHLIESELHQENDLVVVGESFSAELSLAFAAGHPEQVRAVILSGGYVRPPWPSWCRWLIHPILVRAPLPSFLIRFFAVGRTASDSFVDWVRTAFQIPCPNVMAHRAKQALSLDFTECLIKCKVPILYLAPDSDRLVPRRNLNWILKNRPDVCIHEIHGPHLILQTSPSACWSAIEAFVR